MTLPSFLRGRIGRILPLLAAMLLLTLAGLLLREHVRALRVAREETVPLAVESGDAERRVKMLQSQLEAIKLQAQVSGGSVAEELRLFVLPQGAEIERALLFLDGTFDVLRGQGRLLDVSPIVAGDAQDSPVDGSLKERTLAFSMTLREEALPDLLRLLNLSGLLTVEDALRPEDRASLLALAEAEDPSRITAVKQYFSTDLFAYMRAPEETDDRLFASYSSAAFASALRRITLGAAFREESQLLHGPFGDMLDERKLWPLPFLFVAQMQVQEGKDGWREVQLALKAVGKK